MVRTKVASLLVLTVVAVAPICGADEPPVVIPGEVRATAVRLAEARKHIDAKEWAEALDELQSVLDANGNDLVAVDARRSLQARRLVHAAIASLPAEALELYRGRVDRRAARWLEEGIASRDARMLRKVVEEAFGSRPAEKALDLLGDLAFERGRYDEALAWWRLLTGPAAAQAADDAADGDLVYPRPREGPARARAKQLLAELFRDGPSVTWAQHLKAYCKAHGMAEGALAGRNGRYADTLEALAGQRQEEGTAAPDWATFGGNPARGLLVPDEGGATDTFERLVELCREGPAWRVDLEGRKALDSPVRGTDGSTPRGGPIKGLTALARTLAFHPVITSTHAVVADAAHVTAVDLASGAVYDWFDAGPEEGAAPDLVLPAPPDLRNTLTFADGRFYVRLGAQDLRAPDPEAAPGRRRAGPEATSLACLGMASAQDGERKPRRALGARLRWRLRGPAGGPFFEGAPLADAGRVFVATTRYTEQRAITSIDCYGDEGETPPLRWRRDVAETREPRPDESRYRHHLLTLAGPLVVYCSHTGTIMAVDAFSGQPAWAVRYPRGVAEDDDETLEVIPTKAQQVRTRDLTPVLYADDRLYAAPADSDHLLCLDPASGRVLWQRERMRVVHLLGVGRGRLIFATATGLRAVRAADGSDKDGWVMPDSDVLPPMGRGLLLGDLVLWPTARWREIGGPGFMVYAVRQSDGRPAGDPMLLRRLPAGNLAFAHGCLAVADQQTLTLFVPPRLRLEQRRAAAVRRPRSSQAHLALARAQRDAGLLDEARTEFTRAEELARTLDGPSRRQQVEEARLGRWEVEREVGRRAMRSGDRAEAETAFALAAAKDMPSQARLRAWTDAASLWEKAGDPTRALAAWERVLASPALRSLVIEDERGLPVAAGAIAATAARRLCARLGGCPSTSEDRARQLWSSAGEHRAETALRLADELPHTHTAQVSLREAAEFLEKAHRPGTAAGAWRRLAAMTEGDKHARALAELARCLAPRSGPASLPALPLERTWHASLATGETFLPGARLLACPSLVFTACGQELIARRLTTGEVAWKRSLPFAPRWASVHAECAIAAGANGIAALRQEDGGESWLLIWEQDRSPELTAFQLRAGRLYCLQEGRLLAFDADTGRCLWQRWAPGGEFHLAPPSGRFLANYQASSGCVLVQSGAGRFQLLDAVSGRLLSRPQLASGPGIGAPGALDDALVVSSSRQVLMLDGATGRELWRHVTPGVTLNTGEPVRLLGKGDALAAVTPTNLGYRLEGLDRATGKASWRRPELLRVAHTNPEDWAIDKDAVYLTADGVLSARSLVDGQVLWERPVPEATVWTVRRVADSLFAWPCPDRGPHFRFQCLGSSLQWVKDQGLDAQAGFPVLVCDPKTGALTQRLNFTSLPRCMVRKESPLSITLCTASLAPLPPGHGPSVPPAVSIGPGGAIVALPNDLWGLTSTP